MVAVSRIVPCIFMALELSVAVLGGRVVFQAVSTSVSMRCWGHDVNVPCIVLASKLVNLMFEKREEFTRKTSERYDFIARGLRLQHEGCRCGGVAAGGRCTIDDFMHFQRGHRISKQKIKLFVMSVVSAQRWNQNVCCLVLLAER